MLRRLAVFAVLVTGASAAPMTYTVTGTGSGSWNSQPFTDASFTFTFTADTAQIVHGTSCCSGADSTPAGTTATVTVSGFAPATLTGDQAIFLNRAEQTAGIWHINSPDYLTLAIPQFATADLATPIGPTSGTTFSYVTPLPLSTGGTLYFSSVHDVSYSQQSGSADGQLSTKSVTPNSGTAFTNEAKMYSVVISDTAGAGDISGLDLQFRDEPTYPQACWLYYNASANTLTMNHQNNWGQPMPIGSSGGTLTGDACTVDTTGATVGTSGNDLTLNVPVQLTYADNQPWSIFVAVQNKQNQSTDYTQLGTATPQSPQSYGFTLTVDPTSQEKQVGTSVDYKVTVQGYGGFDEPVTLSATSIPNTSGNSTPLTITFNPTTIGTGTSTMTVSSEASATPDGYTIEIKGASQSRGKVTDAGLQLDNGAPFINVSPASGSGLMQTFTFTWADSTPINGMNILFSPSLDGTHACWIYFDIGGVTTGGNPHRLLLASDDGASWMDAGNAGYLPFDYGDNGQGSNSQCTIGADGTSYNPDLGIGTGHQSGYNTLTMPITFTPAFAGTKTIYVRSSNNAGFDSGYLPKGSWSVQ